MTDVIAGGFLSGLLRRHRLCLCKHMVVASIILVVAVVVVKCYDETDDDDDNDALLR